MIRYLCHLSVSALVVQTFDGIDRLPRSRSVVFSQ